MIMSEIRFAARVLARSPGFTLLAALLLALGIGANTVIFGALDAILLRPLPVRNPERLVRFVQDIPRVGRRSMFPYSFYETLRDRSTTLAEVFGEAETQVAMAGSMAAEEVRVHLVTPEFFQVVNTPPLLGRTLSAADAAETGNAAGSLKLRLLAEAVRWRPAGCGADGATARPGLHGGWRAAAEF
jgi:hypothetical protein